MNSEVSLNTSDCISMRDCSWTLKDTPSHNTTKVMPQINLLGSMHIPVTDPYEGITDGRSWRLLPHVILCWVAWVLLLRKIYDGWARIELQSVVSLRACLVPRKCVKVRKWETLPYLSKHQKRKIRKLFFLFSVSFYTITFSFSGYYS